ncbi:TraI domain-containing protein [Vibrio sp. Y2-5]|uniref:TraI domain-containing protein n=1 Tax=Vibrio sp. Y2-5 TaxID=2743977 RepID=UPI001661607A|nr:TraI domain-containing protein [Vibrio sp. Y2-5]MBD0788150.1 TraI domain-containing protein [Vibrio sp. Y2-5]
MFKNIIPFLRKSQESIHTSKSEKEEKENTFNGLQIDRFLDGSTILAQPNLDSLIRKIRVTVGVSDEYFNQYYLPVLEKVASYCQSISASESYHHTQPFGLITHLVEATLYALRARLQFIYTITGKEEDIDGDKNLFSYAVFIAALHHDLGKAISDNRFFVRVDPKSDFITWSPLSSNPPPETSNVEYRVRRKKSNKTGKVIYKYNSHMLLAPVLLCRTIPKHGYDWISSAHPKLELDLYHAVCGDYENADAIGKSVKIGDTTSTELGKNNVTEIASSNIDSQSTSSTIGKVKAAILRVLSAPTEYSLTVNNENFSTIVKKEDKIYFSGIALYKVLKQEFEKSDTNLPEKTGHFEQMITEAFTIPSPSGDSMWWIKFTKVGAEIDKDKKDIKCFVFDANLFDPEGLLPDANNIDVHLSIKSLSDEDKGDAVKQAINSLAESQKAAAAEDVPLRSIEGKAAPEKFNSSLSGILSQPTSPLSDIPEPSTGQGGKSSTSQKEQAQSEPASKQVADLKVEMKRASQTVSGTDLLGLLSQGSDGHCAPKEIVEPMQQVNPNNDTPQSSQGEKKTKKSKKRKNSSVTSAMSLIPTTADVATVMNEQGKKIDPPANPKPVLPAEQKPDPTPLVPPKANATNSTIKETKPSSPTEHDELTRNSQHEGVDGFGQPIDLMSLVDEEDLPPHINEFSWMEMSEDDFKAALEGTLVSFTNFGSDGERDVSTELSTDDEGVERGNPLLLERPSWSAPINFSESDVPFLVELFGVLQQAINNGLRFNKIGSRLYVVPHGIFIATPSAFLEPEFPLSTRGSYYKNQIRNSSFLAKRMLSPDKNFVTGRIIKFKKVKEDKIVVRHTGALNGFYLVTGNRFTLMYQGKPIKPTNNLVFDHDSVNGVLNRSALIS